MLSLHVKWSLLLLLHDKLYLLERKWYWSEMFWYFIGVYNNKWNIAWLLGDMKSLRMSKIFQHWKRNFMSQHSHVISSICCLSLWYFTCILEMLCLLFQGCQNSDTLFFRYICVYLISAYSSLPLSSQPRMLRQTFQRSCVIQWLPNWKAKSWGHLAVRQ